jgi:methylisocitrate lyase
MADRIKAAVDARTDESFAIMARTDAHAVEGLGPAIERSRKYVGAGADMIFAEALTSLDEYRHFTSSVNVPVLANLTEFGKTPLFTVDEMRAAGVGLVLYPLTAFRMMNAAAIRAYETLRGRGTQKDLLEAMQTRQELYETLDYHAYEAKLDQLFSREKS